MSYRGRTAVYPRNTGESGVSHLPVMVTLPVLSCLRSHIPTPEDEMNDINSLDRISAMRERPFRACRFEVAPFDLRMTRQFSFALEW
jgi:hypothetical protein